MVAPKGKCSRLIKQLTALNFASFSYSGILKLVFAQVAKAKRC